MRRTHSGLCAVVAVVGGLLLCAPPALSFTVIGQTTGTPTQECGRTYVQAASVPPGYEVPAPGGVITSVMTSAGDSPGDVASFKVVVPTTPTLGTGTVYKVIASVGPEILTPNALSTFPARIPVPAGAILALWTPDSEVANCAFSTSNGLDDEIKWSNTAPPDPAVGFVIGDDAMGLKGSPDTRLNMAAVVEPDADGDGFGDETQDGCPTNASIQGPCPQPPPPRDTTAPTVSANVAGAKFSKAGALSFFMTASEASNGIASGTISLPKAAKVVRFKTAKVKFAAGKLTKVTLRLSKKNAAVVRRVLRRHRLKAKVSVAVTDTAGNKRVKKLAIKLKR